MLTGYIHQNDALQHGFKLIEILMQIRTMNIRFFLCPESLTSPTTLSLLHNYATDENVEQPTHERQQRLAGRNAR